MNEVKFKRGLAEKADTFQTPFEDGSILFTEDSHELFVDSENERKQIGTKAELVTVDNKVPSIYPEDAEINNVEDALLGLKDTIKQKEIGLIASGIDFPAEGIVWQDKFWLVPTTIDGVTLKDIRYSDDGMEWFRLSKLIPELPDFELPKNCYFSKVYRNNNELYLTAQINIIENKKDVDWEYHIVRFLYDTENENYTVSCHTIPFENKNNIATGIEWDKITQTYLISTTEGLWRVNSDFNTINKVEGFDDSYLSIAIYERIDGEIGDWYLNNVGYEQLYSELFLETTTDLMKYTINENQSLDFVTSMVFDNQPKFNQTFKWFFVPDYQFNSCGPALFTKTDGSNKLNTGFLIYAYSGEQVNYDTMISNFSEWDVAITTGARYLSSLSNIEIDYVIRDVNTDEIITPNELSYDWWVDYRCYGYGSTTVTAANSKTINETTPRINGLVDYAQSAIVRTTYTGHYSRPTNSTWSSLTGVLRKGDTIICYNTVSPYKIDEDWYQVSQDGGNTWKSKVQKISKLDNTDLPNFWQPLEQHIADKENPHEVTAEQVGLQNAVISYSDLKTTMLDIDKDLQLTLQNNRLLQNCYNQHSNYFAYLITTHLYTTNNITLNNWNKIQLPIANYTDIDYYYQTGVIYNKSNKEVPLGIFSYSNTTIKTIDLNKYPNLLAPFYCFVNRDTSNNITLISNSDNNSWYCLVLDKNGNLVSESSIPDAPFVLTNTNFQGVGDTIYKYNAVTDLYAINTNNSITIASLQKTIDIARESSLNRNLLFTCKDEPDVIYSFNGTAFSSYNFINNTGYSPIDINQISNNLYTVIINGVLYQIKNQNLIAINKYMINGSDATINLPSKFFYDTYNNRYIVFKTLGQYLYSDYEENAWVDRSDLFSFDTQSAIHLNSIGNLESRVMNHTLDYNNPHRTSLTQLGIQNSIRMAKSFSIDDERYEAITNYYLVTPDILIYYDHYSNPYYFYSLDKGETFEKSTFGFLKEYQHYMLLYYINNTYYGFYLEEGKTSFGIIKSDDGITWEPFRTGLIDAEIINNLMSAYDLKMMFLNNQFILYNNTHYYRTGIWFKSTTDFTNFTTLSNPIPTDYNTIAYTINNKIMIFALSPDVKYYQDIQTRDIKTYLFSENGFAEIENLMPVFTNKTVTLQDGLCFKYNQYDSLTYLVYYDQNMTNHVYIYKYDIESNTYELFFEFQISENYNKVFHIWYQANSSYNLFTPLDNNKYLLILPNQEIFIIDKDTNTFETNINKSSQFLYQTDDKLLTFTNKNLLPEDGFDKVYYLNNLPATSGLDTNDWTIIYPESKNIIQSYNYYTGTAEDITDQFIDLLASKWKQL